VTALLDECVSRKIKTAFTRIEVSTAKEAGLTGIRNGELIRRANEDFDALITVDQNMWSQQNLACLRLILLVIRGADTRTPALLPLVPQVEEALHNAEPGSLVFLDQGGEI